MRASLLVLTAATLAGTIAAGCSSGGGGSASCDSAWQVNNAAEANGDLAGALAATGTASETGGVLTLSQATPVTIPQGDFAAVYSKRFLTGDFSVTVNLSSWVASTTGGGPAFVIANGMKEGTLASFHQGSVGPTVVVAAYETVNNNTTLDVKQALATSSGTIQVTRGGGNILITTSSAGVVTSATQPSSGPPLTVGLGLLNQAFGSVTGTFSATFAGFTVTSGGGCVRSNFQ